LVDPVRFQHHLDRVKIKRVFVGLSKQSAMGQMIGVGIPIILMIRPYPFRILPGGVGNNINAINIVTSLCEPEALHRMVYRAKGAAISFLSGLLRRPALRGTPRNDTFLIAFVLIKKKRA